MGRVDPDKDRPGLREARLEAQLNAAKAAELGRKDEALDPATVAVTADDRDNYLAQVYKDADIAKPRNAIGFAKSLPPEEMRALLLSHIDVDDAALAELARARAEAVRANLAARVDAQRLFIAAPKLDATGVKDEGATTRVEFALH